MISRDLRHVLGQLRRAPGFTAAVLLTLAVGIGATSAMFTVVKTVLLAPVPYAEDQDRVLVLREADTATGRTTSIALPNFLDWQQRARSFSAIGVFRRHEATLAGRSEAMQLGGAVATSGVFAALGVAPIMGRSFVAGDDRPAAEPALLLREDLWQQVFGGDPSSIGRTVTLDGVAHTLVGVMPRRFRFPDGDAKLWVSYGAFIAQNPKLVDREDHRGFYSVAHLAAGVTADAARDEMAAIGRQLAAEHPATNATMGVNLRSIYDDEVGGTRPTLLVLFGAVGFLLLVAVANAVALLLARGIRRSREMAIRTALGAARRHIFTLIFVETCVLALASGVVSFLVAAWGVDALFAVAPDSMPRLGATGPDWRVAVFTTAVSLLVGVLVGVLPAFHAAGAGMQLLLKDTPSVLGGRPLRAQSLVLVTQVALALVLTAGAAVTLRHAIRLRALAPGIDPDEVVVMRLRLPEHNYPGDAQRAAFSAALLERMAALPGVAAVGTAWPGPMDGGSWGMGFATAPIATGMAVPTLDHSPVSPGFFRALGIPLIAGRSFGSQDTGEAPRTVILSVAAARRIFGDRDPIGSTVKLGGPNQLVDERFAATPAHTVVGVVGDVRTRGLLRDSPGQIYVPWAQRPQPAMQLYVKSPVGAASLLAAIRAQVLALDPGLAVYDVRPMSEVAYTSLANQRFTTLLFFVFAGIAVFLAGIGIYGLVAFLVGQRTREIGVRVALGARRRDIVRLVLGRVMVLFAGGVAVGLLATAAMSRIMASLLAGATADVGTLALVAGGFFGIAAVACVLPLRRALNVPPAVALST